MTVRGWYRRTPGPLVELRGLTSARGKARAWEWAARYAAAFVTIGVGLIVLLASLA